MIDYWRQNSAALLAALDQHAVMVFSALGLAAGLLIVMPASTRARGVD